MIKLKAKYDIEKTNFNVVFKATHTFTQEVVMVIAYLVNQIYANHEGDMTEEELFDLIKEMAETMREEDKNV